MSKRRREAAIAVAITTANVEKEIDVELAHERIVIDRVPIGLQVDVVPAVRIEGDTTIYPIVEEIVVVEKRLVLKEEVRVRRLIESTTHRELIPLRAQHVQVTRKPIE